MKLHNLPQQMVTSAHTSPTNFAIKQKQTHFQILIPTNAWS